MIKRMPFFLMFFLLALWACKSENNQAKNKSIPVRVLTLHPDSISIYAEVTGNLEAQHDALVLSKTSERLTEIRKPVGSAVQAGDIIAALNNTLLEQGMLQAQAALNSARARYQNVKSDYERYQRLYRAKAVSDQQWQTIKSSLEEAKAGLEQMEAAYAQAKERYWDSFIKAPFSGIVGSIYFDIGQMVGMGQPVAKIINPSLMKAKLYVPDLYLGKIEPEQCVQATFPALGKRTFDGRIVRIDPAIDPVSRTILAEAIFDNHDKTLTSGLYGLFKIKITQKKNTIIIPDNAILSRTEVKINRNSGESYSVKKFYVFVVQDSMAKMVAVQKGLAYGDRVEIVKGLHFGDKVIVVGQFSLKEGEKVLIRTNE